MYGVLIAEALKKDTFFGIQTILINKILSAEDISTYQILCNFSALQR